MVYKYKTILKSRQWQVLFVPCLLNASADMEITFVKEQFMKSIARWTKSAAVILAVVLAFPFITGVRTVRNFVTIRDEGKPPVSLLTDSEDPNEILKEADIDISKHDTYAFQEYRDGIFRLTIDRAFPVTVICGKVKSEVFLLEGTVADVLKSAEITLGGEDLITPALTEKVTPETVITIQRVTYSTSVAAEAIPYETVERRTPLLKNGKTRTLEEGTDGEMTTTTVAKYIDGVYTETVSVSTAVTKEPIPAVTLVGDSSAAVTTLEAPQDLTLDANGNPVSYVRKIVGKGTAYSARDGAKTASGRYAIPGHVAVNPNVIPYGSKLYIKSSDGSFVYGYAVAADTGIALMDGRVTVDLFFDTYLESCLFGAKTMEIYVLE
jgi:3D (Asp-Asp-Asp) domain-containing protein